MKSVNLIDVQTDNNILGRLIGIVPKEYQVVISKYPKKYLLEDADSESRAIIFNYGTIYRNTITELEEQGCIVLPNVRMSELCRNRFKSTKLIEDLSRCYIKREYFKSNNPERLFFEKNKVYKIGNFHQGCEKFIQADGSKVIYNEKYLVEEYIEGRSFRVLIIGPDTYVIEHINKNNWIKNINPDEEIVYKYPLSELSDSFDVAKMIDDAHYINRQFIRNKLISPTVGFDYVVNKDRVCLLEVNDICGLPSDEDIINSYVHECIRLLKLY